MRASISASALTVLATLAGTSHCASADGKWTIDTTNGRITGHAAANTKNVVEFLGVPYAKPPVGELRWAAPQKLDSKKDYEAKDFGFDCPLTPSPPSGYPGLYPNAQQILNYFASGSGTPQSEDCLTLNVWTGSDNSQKVDRPILVFFYGGRFTVGNTNTPFYTGKYFAEAEDIIFITVNYRTNIFGFPGAPGADTNLGLRDQRAAVEWVKNNAKSFGGDPKKITISGQSSGGVSVDYWTYAYKDDPIANAIYAPSGNAFSFPVNAPGVPEEHWNEVVEAVGCDGADDALACMREVDWQDIKEAAAGVRPTPSSSPLRSIPAFYPQPDEKYVFSDYLSLTEAGSFAKIPVLMGNNNNEDGFYRIPAFANGVVPTDEQVRVFLLESFTCPVSFQARARRQHDVPAWTYRYMADWENTRLYNTSGAYHGVDLHMFLGASGDVSGVPPSAEQKKLTKYTQQALRAFCNNPWDALHDFGWEMFSDSENSLAVIGEDEKARAEFVKPSVYDAACSTITLGALNTPSS